MSKCSIFFFQISSLSFKQNHSSNNLHTHHYHYPTSNISNGSLNNHHHQNITTAIVTNITTTANNSNNYKLINKIETNPQKHQLNNHIPLNHYNFNYIDDVNMTNGNNNNNLIHDPLLQQQPMDITPITSIDTSSNILSSIEFNHTSQNHQNLFKNFHNTLLNNNDNHLNNNLMSSFNNNTNKTATTTIPIMSSPTPIRSPAIQAKSIQINKTTALPGAQKRPPHLRMNNEET